MCGNGQKIVVDAVVDCESREALLWLLIVTESVMLFSYMSTGYYSYCTIVCCTLDMLVMWLSSVTVQCVCVCVCVHV